MRDIVLEDPYCWTCCGTGQVREQPVDDLSGYVDCPCIHGLCGCGCCSDDQGYDDEDDW